MDYMPNVLRLTLSSFQVNDWAKEAFFTFGGNPRYTFDLKPATLGPNYSMSHDITVNQGMSEYY